MRVLIIEDEAPLRAHTAEALAAAGFVVDQAADGIEGRHIALDYPVDVAVVDLGLPGIDGLEIIRALRAAGLRYPVLILTARGRWQDKVTGLEAGADDYLVKPFHMEELIARLHALLRRAGGWADPVLRHGPIRVDTRTEQVSVDGTPVTLTAYEYRLLAYLMHHPGEVLSKTRLMEHLYADDDQRDSNVIEVFMRRLRRKLDPTGARQPIETLRGRGYRLKDADATS
ncbi:response regulator transcription factor [Arhodomonas sp. AD133]|uniref:response regulator transcription factor n=1 Tax=Arhodomonas sp. AD133 TaxID=3415009 RepID=UPI003EBEC57A